MRHFLSFTAISLFLSCLNTFAITLPQAIALKKVNVTFVNMGDYSGPHTEMTITNLSKEKLEFNSGPGLIIQSEDSTSQKLVISDPVVSTLMSGKSFIKIVNTFCINSSKAGPQQGEKYSFLKEGDSYLTRLVTFINEKKTAKQESQFAVWACMNGHKSIYIENEKSVNLMALKKLVAEIYEQKFAAGLIPKDTVSKFVNYKNFHIQGSHEFFVKEEGSYSAQFEDSTGAKLITFFENQPYKDGMYPIRFMHAYRAEFEKSFYVAIYKNGTLLQKVKAINETSPKQYVRLSHKSGVVFNIAAPVTADLNLIDSLGNVYVNYFKGRKMSQGIIPFDYSFTVSKPRKATLYLALTDPSGKVYYKQKINYTQNLMPLQGYFYVRLYENADAIFGLYSADDKLIEEFSSKKYYKGLQMLPYGFMFDKTSKDEVFIKLKDKFTGKDIQSEKVFVK